MNNKSSPADNLDFSNEKIAILRNHLESGIRRLSSITSKARNQHPLLVAQIEREYRLQNRIYGPFQFKTYSVKHFHNRAATSIEILKKFNNRIDTWSTDCAKSLEDIYPNSNYPDQFMAIRFDQKFLLGAPNKIDRKEESLAEIQIKLKTQLENLIYFLVRRIAYLEEFGEYPSLMSLDLLVDIYTRRFLDILVTARLFDWIDIYPDYYDPLFIIMTNEQAEKLRYNEKADLGSIIDVVKSLIVKPSRRLFSIRLAVPIFDGTEYSKDICDDISIVRDDWERDLKKTIGKEFRDKFKKQWDKEIISVGQIYDLMAAIIRLPAYLRDSMPIAKRTDEKRVSKTRGKRPTRSRNIKIQKEYHDLLKNKGKSHEAAKKFLSKKYDLSQPTIDGILYKSQE